MKSHVAYINRNQILYNKGKKRHVTRRVTSPDPLLNRIELNLNGKYLQRLARYFHDIDVIWGKVNLIIFRDTLAARHYSSYHYYKANV